MTQHRKLVLFEERLCWSRRRVGLTIRRRADGGKGAGAEGHHPDRVARIHRHSLAPALDYRHSWSSVPAYVAALGNALAALCFAITFLVCKENTFTSATIEIAEGQGVIWDAQMLFFGEHGFRVIAHDRRGHGCSTPDLGGQRYGHLRGRPCGTDGKS